MLRPAVRSALESASDAILSSRAVDGDVEAFEIIVRRHGPLMRAYATRVLGSNQEVDDVVQDAFITAWHQLATLDDPSALRSWLMRTVSRKSIDRLRARRLHADVDDVDAASDESTGPDRVVTASSLGEALDRALASLPVDQRRTWVLKEFGDYGYAEIARELDLPISTVRGLLSRARRTLMREMEEWR